MCSIALVYSSSLSVVTKKCCTFFDAESVSHPAVLSTSLCPRYCVYLAQVDALAMTSRLITMHLRCTGSMLGVHEADIQANHASV